MTILNHEIFVAASPAKVWHVLSDLTAVQHYNPTVASAKLAGDQDGGIGASRECQLKPKGSVTERVTIWQPNSAIGLEVIRSDWPIVFMNWRTDISPNSEGVRVTQKLEYKLKFGPIGALLDSLVMRRKLDGAIRDVFDHLKRYVEARE